MFVQKIMIGLLLAIAAPDGGSAPEVELLHQAEAAFHKGSGSPQGPEAERAFREAATAYEELRRRGILNTDLFRNQGNAYLLAGDLPQAILSYRRGLRLAPGDLDLQTNLAFARDQVVYFSAGRFGRPPADSWPPGLRWPSPQILVVLIFFFYSLGCAALTRARMIGSRWLLGCGLAVLAVSLWIGATQASQEGRQGPDVTKRLVIVSRDGVWLRRGNGPAYPARYDTPLSRGMEARLRFDRGDWLQIELSGGEMGWVPRASVLVDMP